MTSALGNRGKVFKQVEHSYMIQIPVNLVQAGQTRNTHGSIKEYTVTIRHLNSTMNTATHTERIEYR